MKILYKKDMPFIVIIREVDKSWGSSYGLFKTKQDALDYVNGKRDEHYKYYIDTATDEEIDKSIAIKVRNGASMVSNPEMIGTRQIYKTPT